VQHVSSISKLMQKRLQNFCGNRRVSFRVSLKFILFPNYT